MSLSMHKLHLGDGDSTRANSPSIHTTQTMGRTASSQEPRSGRMKLFVDAGAGRVVFAEAGKDVVDFLFSLLALPLGRVDRVLAPLGGTGGSVSNLYASMEQLDPAHVKPGGAARQTLLSPTVLSPPARAELTFHRRRELYTCSTGIYSFDCGKNVTDGWGTKCPSCGDPMTVEARYVPPGQPAAGDVGFVRGGDAARYVVTDNLRVVPAPTTAGELVALFTALGVGNVGALQQSDVQLGFTQVEKNISTDNYSFFCLLQLLDCSIGVLDCRVRRY
jgi:hypothetical protein